MDPPEVHEEIANRFLVSDRYSEYWSATKRNAVTMLTSMQSSPYQKQLMEMLEENNINAVLPHCQVANNCPNSLEEF